MIELPFKLMDILTGAKEFSLLIFGAVGAYVALKGLNAWKTELNWSHEKELKRNILIELYRLESTIENLRTPRVTTTVIDPKSETSHAVQNFNSYAKGYSESWDSVQEHYNILRSYLPEIRATWGLKLLENIQELEPHLLKLHWAIHDQLEVRNPNVEQSIKTDLRKDRKERSVIIYRQRDKDSFREDIEHIIKTIEDYLADIKS